MYKKQKVLAIILARSQSQRLKDKMFLPFAGHKTVIESVINRVKSSRLIDHIVLATSDNEQDHVFHKISEQTGIDIFFGSENDVVSRMIGSLKSVSMKPDIIVRVCADNPLLMPSLVDEGIEELVDKKGDVITPFENNTYPFGLSSVVMTSKCLNMINLRAVEPIYREHVENFCFDNSSEFSIILQIAPTNLACPELCLTLDYLIDYERLKIYAKYLVDIGFKEQPRAIIDKFWGVTAVIVGSNQRLCDKKIQILFSFEKNLNKLSGKKFDLIISASWSKDLENFVAERGVIWSDAKNGGLLCRLKDRSPFFIYKEPSHSNETDEGYMHRVMPRAVNYLLAGPSREFTLRHKNNEKSIVLDALN